MARTLLFNYGRGDLTPHSIFLRLCSGCATKPELSEPADFRGFISMPQLNFFSKEKRFNWPFFVLYDKMEDEDVFLGLGTVEKLAWINNFNNALMLLTHNTAEQLVEINEILLRWKRADYDCLKLPNINNLDRTIEDVINRGRTPVDKHQFRSVDGSISNKGYDRFGDKISIASPDFA